jgi:dolichol-phosphate mannosyltransferase
MNKTLIFTATFNESKNIEELISKIFDLNKNVDLLIVDDNSPDKTYEIIEGLATKNKNIFLKKREKKDGLNTAHTYGYDFAIKQKYEKFITMDADLSHDPIEIPKIIDLLNNEAFVIGSRYIAGGKNDMTKGRLLLSKLGNRFIKTILASKCTEFTSSFRGFNLTMLKNFHFNQIQSNGYSFFMETVIKLNFLGYASYEFPIHFKNREFGESKIPKGEIYRTLFNVLRLYIYKKKNNIN